MPDSGSNSATLVPGCVTPVEPPGLPLPEMVLVGPMGSLWVEQPPSANASARIPAAVRLRITLELLTQDRVARRACQAPNRFLCLVGCPHRSRPLPPVLFERFWTRQARVRSGRESWQGQCAPGGRGVEAQD